MTSRLESLLERLRPVVREEMLKVAVTNCCIATVAVLCGVFRHYRFNARPLAAKVMIFNPQFVKRLKMGAPVPTSRNELKQWTEATGAWSVGLVPESEGPAWARGDPGFGGHLLCHVQDLLIDASLDQANRPQKQIVLPSFFVLPVFPEFMRGEKAMVGSVNGCEVRYEPLRNQIWRNSPDWVRRDRYRDALNAIIKRTKCK